MSGLPHLSIDADPASARGLPAWAYTDPRVLEIEKRAIFHKAWLYAGWIGDLAKPGDYLTARVIDQEVIVLRGEDGALHGFHNTCQHRGSPLLVGRGRCDGRIVCPYHAWTYRLDGTL